jgi:hypothetical protein
MVRPPHRRPNRRLEGNCAFFPSLLSVFRTGVASQTNRAQSATSREKFKTINPLAGQAANPSAIAAARLTREIALPKPSRAESPEGVRVGSVVKKRRKKMRKHKKRKMLKRQRHKKR